MAKYSIEDKKKFIELIELKKYSLIMIAKLLNIPISVIRRWEKMYTHHGLEGLLIKNKTYSGDFKLNVLRYMYDNHLSVSEASAIFKIPSDSTLLKWERIYYEEGEEGLLKDKRGRPKLNMDTKKSKKQLPKSTEEDLINEVQRLRAEVDYLKKLNALVKEKEKLQQRKK